MSLCRLNEARERKEQHVFVAASQSAADQAERTSMRNHITHLVRLFATDLFSTCRLFSSCCLWLVGLKDQLLRLHTRAQEKELGELQQRLIEVQTDSATQQSSLAKTQSELNAARDALTTTQHSLAQSQQALAQARAKVSCCCWPRLPAYMTVV